MSSFSGSEYYSYRALCLELHLQHGYHQGDWYLDTLYEPPNDLFVTTPYDERSRNSLADRIAWLPLLSDWLEMLNDLNWYQVCFNRVAADSGGGWITIALDPVFKAYTGEGPFPTREEAAARLWMKVMRVTSTD